MKYRSKPIIKEAFQWTPGMVIPLWAADKSFPIGGSGQSLYLHTFEGVMHAEPGDYIIKGIMGEVYPCKPHIFEASYELVEEGEKQ